MVHLLRQQQRWWWYWWIFALWIDQCLGQMRAILHPPTVVGITFGRAGEWQEISVPERADGPASTTNGSFVLFFRASAFSLHLTQPAGSSISIWLDGKRSTTPFVPVIQSTNDTAAYWTSGLANISALDVQTTFDDHQLVVDISASQTDPVIVDGVLLLNTTIFSEHYTLTSSAPGMLMDNDDELVTYSDVGWQRQHDPFFAGETSSITSTPGAWFQLTFTGSGIWVYGAIPVEGTVFSVEVIKKDGREDTRAITTYNVTRPGLDIPLYQAPLLDQKGLAYATAYVYKFTLLSGTFMIDFFGVDGTAIPANAADIHTTEPIAPTGSTPNLRILIPSVVCGVVIFLLICIACFFFVCKRYRIRRGSGLGIETIQGSKEATVVAQPFHTVSSIHHHNDEGRPTKGSLLPRFHTSLLRPSPTSSSSQHLTSTLPPTNSVSSTQPSVRLSLAEWESSREPSGGFPPGNYEIEEDGETLSLSHADLAIVFRRAEQLRQLGADADGATSEALEPHLEALARQLATRRQQP